VDELAPTRDDTPARSSIDLLRAFIAIEIPPSLQEKLHREMESLRARLDRTFVRWVVPENIHLTLKFLGDTPITKLDALKEFLAAELARFQPFEISVGNMGVFPNFSRPRVIWLGVEDKGKLSSLQRHTERAARQIGSAPEKRRFSAHLTLGRVKQDIRSEARHQIRQVVEENSGLELGNIHVDTIHLFQSELKANGAVYRSLYQINLEKK